jgi:alpha-galactosidase
MEQPITLKIAYIGGGSRDWARKLMIDLALCPELSGEVALYDIDMQSANLNTQLGTWLQTQPGVLSKWKYTAVEEMDAALLNADIVIVSIQPGTFDIMQQEIALAEEHGMFFPVGDTTGITGLMRGLRSAAIYQGFAEKISEICPNAWIINYTNPMSICTWSMKKVAPDLKVFGCCHEVFSTQKMLARVAAKKLNIELPRRNEIKVNVIGINHFTWVNQAEYQGHDLLALLREYIEEPGVLREYTQAEVESWHDWFHSADQVKFNLFKHYGILAAAGDRHLVEFLPGFIRSPENLFKWGVIRTPVSWRISRWTTAPQKTQDLINGVTPFTLESSGEEGVGMIKALLGIGDLVTNVNMANTGQISNMKLGAVVETNAHFSQQQVKPICAGPLPDGIAGLVNLHSINQELIIDAVLEQQIDMAFQAFYTDPNTILDIDAAWKLFKKMLHLNQEFVPWVKVN